MMAQVNKWQGGGIERDAHKVARKRSGSDNERGFFVVSVLVKGEIIIQDQTEPKDYP